MDQFLQAVVLGQAMSDERQLFRSNENHDGQERQANSTILLTSLAEQRTTHHDPPLAAITAPMREGV